MTGQFEPIRGKVARILGERDVAFNIGASHGVRVGMLFNIVNIEGSEVRDPDTGDVLGSIEIPKASVRITIVQERISVASTYQTHRVNVGGIGFVDTTPVFRKMFTPPKWETRYETLKVEQPWEELSEEERIVREGDPVVQVLETSDSEESEQEPSSLQMPQ